MKKTTTIVILVTAAALAWAYYTGPASNVEFSFTQRGIGKYKDHLKPIKFAMISDIHIRETPREEITAEKDTREILQQFITSMNNDVQPDFIVQLGDLNDGCLDNCTDFAPDSVIINRLQRAEQYTEEKTDITWFDVIGNHEYVGGYNKDLSVIDDKDFTPVYQAINRDWKSVEDTWYYRDINGYRFIFLNTSFPYQGSAHIAPVEQLSWLEEVLSSGGIPTFVFMHVPVSEGSGKEYDVAHNQEKIIEILANDEAFVAGFFGHCHHSDKWDGLRRQYDDKGNVYFHIPAPHEWMGDKSMHPWVIVTIEPGKDGFTVEVGTGVKRSELSEFLYSYTERLVKISTRILANLGIR